MQYLLKLYIHTKKNNESRVYEYLFHAYNDEEVKGFIHKQIHNLKEQKVKVNHVEVREFAARLLK